MEVALLCVALAVGYWTTIAQAQGTVVAAIGGVGLACVGTPALRRWIVGRGRALVVRHRFQGVCLDTAMRTRKGRLPLVLATTVSDEGVVLVVWLRRGLSPELVGDYLPEIATACFARRATISPHHFGAQVIMLVLR
ncbi:hypothetical protein [Sphaerisporangium aureirubrum]|uniref:Uncharacterized protein n=1 Tax=Sphaerisporangium aureirubrum TaxID=1544736 RepID=A0ABW1NKJ4_9ACTN